MLVNTQFELSKLVLINEQKLLFSLSTHLNPASADQIHSIPNFFRQALLSITLSITKGKSFCSLSCYMLLEN